MTRHTTKTAGFLKMLKKLEFCERTTWSADGRRKMLNGIVHSITVPRTKNGSLNPPNVYNDPPMTGPTENPRPIKVSKTPCVTFIKKVQSNKQLLKN